MINGIGDIVCVTPAIESVRRRYPTADLAVIVRPHLAGLLAGSPFVDRVFEYEVGAPWRRLAYLYRLRRERFDLWVDLHMPTFNTVSSNARDLRRNALLAAASGSRYRLGYAHPALGRRLTHPVPVPSEERLRTENIVDTTTSLIHPDDVGKYRKHVPVTDADRRWAAEHFPQTQEPRIALFFGSRQPADLWPEELIFDLVRHISGRWPHSELVMIGGEHERELAQRLTASDLARNTRLRSFIDRTTFGQTAALLERCHAFVGTDSGATHIADAVGLPIVALFSSKNYPRIWAPITRGAVVLNRPIACGPCLRADCPSGNECMRLISPQSVMDALVPIIDRRAFSP